MLIIVYSARTKQSLLPPSAENDISIDQISNDNPILNINELTNEGKECMYKLLEYTLSSHISSVNLISSICALSNIAKQRPNFMEIVLDSYKKLLGMFSNNLFIFCLISFRIIYFFSQKIFRQL